MLRPALAAVAAIALALAALVAPATIAPVAPASAATSGSGLLFATGGSTCTSDIANPCRAAIEWRTSFYGPTGAGETQVKRRTFFSVYAVAGEQILVGSSSIGVGSADIVVWNPGLISETGVNTVDNANLPTPSFSCAAQRGTSGNGTRGVLDTRAKETAGPQSVDGTGNTTGYRPCNYAAPSTGIYRVAFYGTAGGLSNNDSGPNATQAVIAPAGGAKFDNSGTNSTAVLAWDITVRSSDLASTANRPGRAYTYSFALSTGANPRPVVAAMYLNTTDGFRYRVNTRGLDGNGFAYYGNRSGFLDADGTPLNHDVVATGASVQTLQTLLGGTHLAPPEYPLSLEPLAAETLTALGIPTSPTNPVLNSVVYTGKKTASGSYLNQGGTFTVDTGTGGTYEIVVSRNGTDFDPGLPGNATLRGVVNAAGVYTVPWDGKDNSGTAFPVGDDYAVHAALRGGEYHAPMIDIESSFYGGPSITLENPPNGICPFTGVASTGSNCTTAFFDDRGYTTSSGVDVGTPGGMLCPSFVGTVPNPLFSDPVTGFDSAGSARAFGTQGNNNANAYCPATNGTLGDAKGLDIWTFFPSALKSTRADVLPLPTAPVAAADSATTPVGTTLTRSAAQGVLVNDLGTGLTVTSHTTPASGTLTIAADGSYVYVPVAGFTGTVTSTYTVTDDAGQTATAVLTIAVTPRAVDDADATPANTPLTRGAAAGVLANDSGTGLTVTGFTPLAADTGSLTINANGSYSYTPPAGFSGTASSTYTAKDSSGQTTTAVLTITVTPVAVNDSDSTRAGTPLTRGASAGVLGNDAGSGLTVTGFTPLPASEGSLTVNLDGSYTFTPAAGFSGTTSSVYTVTDAHGRTSTATLTITVRPEAVADTVSTPHGTALSRDAASGVLANDLGTGLTVTGFTAPASGSLAIEADGSYSYTPASGFGGTVTSTYTIRDAEGRTDTAVLTIRVGPLAVGDTDATDAGVPITQNAAAGVLANDVGAGLTVTGFTAPASGSLTINANGSYTYTPAAGFSGVVTSTYTITDVNGLTATATLRITVIPVTADDTDTTSAGTTLTRTAAAGVLANDVGAGLTVSSFTLPASGTLAIATDGSYTYTPAAGFSGVVTSIYTAMDGAGQNIAATLTITVTPRAVDDADTTVAGTALARDAALGVLADDLGTGLTVTGQSATPGGVGTLVIHTDGGYDYTPAAGYSGSFSVDYQLSDAGGRTDTGRLTITVTPLAVDDTDATTAGAAITRNAAAGVLPDDVGIGLTVTAFTPLPAGQGTLSIAADGSYSYTPAAGFSGDAVSTYTVTDASGGTATATLTIAVTPVAVDDADATTAGTALVRDAAAGVLGNDLGTGLTVTGFTAPASGTLSIAADGSYSYTPAAGFSGDVTSTYTVGDAAGRTTTAVLAIRVNPLAVNDADTTPFGQALARGSAAGVLGNDLGTGLTVTGFTAPASGTLAIAADGSYTFTPAAGFSGVVTSTYTVTDTAGRTATATLMIAVGLAAVDDEDATVVDVPITRDAASGVLVNDGGTGLTVTGFTAPASGALVIAADGSYTFTPAAGFSGVVTSTYTVADATASTATAQLTIRVTPIAVADTDAAAAGTPIARDAAAGVLGNDLGTGLTVTGFTAPASGTLVIAADGAYTYTPAAGFSGDVNSTYTVTDGAGQTTTATLTITVTPVAADDADTTAYETPLSRASGAGVLGNDLGMGLTVTGFTAPASGTLAIAADGAYTYTPAAGFSGVVTSTYTITDAGGRTDTATLTISVTPIAADDADATTAGAALARDAASGVLTNDGGTGLTVTGFTAPASGTLSIASDGSYDYTPAAGFSGVVTSTYTVTDGAGQTTTATLTITVAPVAVDDADATTAGAALVRGAGAGVLVNDLGTGLAVTGFTAPASGTLSIAADGSYTYTPVAGFSGEVVSTYTVRDSVGQLTTALLTITVTPVAVADTDATAAGTALVRDAAAGVLGNDGGTGLAVTAFTAPASGALSIAADGSYAYTPAAGFSGDVVSTYTVTDALGQTTTATLTIAVTPVALDDADATTTGTPISRDAADGVLVNDLGTGLTVTSHTAAAHGTLTIAADGSYGYTPDTGFSGTDSVVYTVRDASGRTTTATLRLTVAPVGGDDVGTTPAGTPLVVPADGVLGNDSGSTLSVVSHTQPVAGTVTMSADGSYTYTPPAGFSGVTTFSYTATDGTNPYTQTVTITVTPVAVDDTAEGEVGQPIVLDPEALLGDDLGTGLTITGTTDGGHGTVTLAPDGTVTYTPEPGFSGQDTFTYTVSGAGGVSTATVTVLVRPAAPDDEIRTRVDESVDSATGRLLAHARGTGVTLHGHTQPAHGTVTVDADGTFRYTPAPGYVGPDAFTYSVVDSFGTVVTGTVSITVLPRLASTGVDPGLWVAAALLALLAGLVLAAAARIARRRREA